MKIEICYNSGMGKIDEIKEEIGWLKVMFGIFTAVDISLLGWLVQNYDKTSTLNTLVSFIIIFSLSLGIIIVNKSAYKKMRQLRDL